MITRLAGRVAVVTASTDGIGLAIAKRLGLEGAHVVVSSRKQDHVDKTVDLLKKDNINVSGLVCHVGKKADRENLIAHAVEKHGQLDILVSNAAVNPVFGPTIETPEDAWDKIMDVNVKCSFLLAQAAMPHLNQSKFGGSVVFVSSIAGFQPFPSLGPYSVSKTALFALTKVLAAESAANKVRVNALAPGIIKTRFSQALWASPEAEKQATQNIPLQRLGEPEDCAGTVAFLCSDDASYVTGETIVTAGGMSSRL
eukprot:m.20149 g.20149  ORF g.20149 m.20149 type:complete len:255 (+) comp12415_c0_seq1:2-766(+)